MRVQILHDDSLPVVAPRKCYSSAMINPTSPNKNQNCRSFRLISCSLLIFIEQRDTSIDHRNEKQLLSTFKHFRQHSSILLLFIVLKSV